MNKIYEFLGSVLVLVVNAVYTVFVWYKLIEWILTPILGIKQLSMIELYCLFVVYSTFKTPNREAEYTKLTFTNKVVVSLVHSTLVLIFGYCASRFL